MTSNVPDEQGAAAAQADRFSRGLGGIVESVFKYRWRLNILLIAGFVLTFFLVRARDPAYVSEAWILVKATDTDTLSEEPVPSDRSRRPFSMHEVHLRLLQTNEVLEDAARTLAEEGVLGLPPTEEDGGASILDLGAPVIPTSPKTREAALSEPEARARSVRRLVQEFIRPRLTVSSPRGSQLIYLSFTDSTPEHARRSLSAILDAYRARYRALNSIEDVGKLWIEEEKVAADHLSQVQGARAEFRRKHRITTNIERQISNMMESISELESLFRAARLDADGLERRIKGVEEALAGLSPWIKGERDHVLNPRRGILLKHVLDLEKELESLVLKDSAHARDLKKRIEKYSRALEEEKEFIIREAPQQPNPTYQQLQMRLMDLKIDLKTAATRAQNLEKRLHAGQSELLRLQELEDDMATLDSAVAEAEKDFQEKKVRMDYLRHAHNLDQAQLRWSCKVIQEPSLPTSPTADKSKMYLAAGVVLTMGLAVLVATLFGMADRTLRSPKELTALTGLVPLSTVPHFGGPRKVHSLIHPGPDPRSAAEPHPPPGVLPEFVRFDAQPLARHHLDYQIDRIIHRYVTCRSPEPPVPDRMIVVCGSLRGEGVTTLSLNLACRLTTKLRFRVLYVDWGKLAGPGTPAGEVAGSEGSTALHDAIEPTAVPGVDAINCDRVFAAGGSGATVSLLAALVERAAPRYDAVVLDAPPILSSGETLDVLRIGPFCLLAVQAHRTPRNLVREALLLATTPPSRLLGVAFNKAHSYAPGFMGTEA